MHLSSSSLILNAEQGWGEEAEFIEQIKRGIEECGFFYHIITLEGIEAHLRRKNSVFPFFKDFSRNLVKVGRNVAMRVNNPNNASKFYIKKLPQDYEDSLFKLDRQARVLITEDYNGITKAIIVQNLGTDQTCFLIQGPKAKDYLETCIDYYNTCALLKWVELENLYKRHVETDDSIISKT